MKYRCLIVDDEPIAQQILEQYLTQIESLEIAGKCSNAFEALNILHQQKIDILFLDIQMPSLSGLDMLKTLLHPPKIILTTAFAEFAVESYEYGVTDYLLKPFSFERFLKAVHKIILPHGRVAETQVPDQHSSTENNFIFFKADKKIHKFLYDDILFFEGNGNYVKIYTTNTAPLMVLEKLSDLQEKLPKQQFLRIHKSFIVNFLHIQQMEGNTVKLKDRLLTISASYRDSIESFIQKNQ
jgi:DNA-binding LytR/AlgR family response regulator